MIKTMQSATDKLTMQIKSDFATLAFYAANLGWHSYSALDEATLQSISTLVAEGYLERSMNIITIDFKDGSFCVIHDTLLELCVQGSIAELTLQNRAMHFYANDFAQLTVVSCDKSRVPQNVESPQANVESQNVESCAWQGKAAICLARVVC